MKDSYLTAGIRFTSLVRLLSRNHVDWNPVYISRILFLLQSSFWSSLFFRLESARFKQALEDSPLSSDPVFIVGHWRTGSTMLHQMMALDPELVAPTLFQVALPENFLVSYRFYQPIFNMMMGASRPMDNVKIGMDEPQEDEYAMFRLTSFSPLEQLIFPSKSEYFLRDAEFIPDDKSVDQWEKSLMEFYKKIQFVSHKRIVSKNPFNSMRVPLLAKLFPEARFIHIVRHPFAVVPSTRHLWSILQKQNVLNRNSYTPTIDEISCFFSQMTNTLWHDLSLMPEERSVEVRHEDIEQDPVGSLRLVYKKIDLPFTDRFENQLNGFISSNTDFKKNVFVLADEEKRVIAKTMRIYMDRYGYKEIV